MFLISLLNHLISSCLPASWGFLLWKTNTPNLFKPVGFSTILQNAFLNNTTRKSDISFNTKGKPVVKQSMPEGRGQRWDLTKGWWGSNVAKPVIQKKRGDILKLVFWDVFYERERVSQAPWIRSDFLPHVTPCHNMIYFLKKSWGYYIFFSHSWGWIGP